MSPKVSIIIPVFNGADLLPETVGSVLGQSFSDWELLIVDDGSTDGRTPQLVDSIAASDPRIHAFHKQQGGPSDTRNFAIPIARGEYITFLDGDDILHPDFITLTLTAAEKFNADIVYSRVDFYVGVFKNQIIPDNPVVESPDPGEVLKKTLYQTKYDNGAWGKLYRARIWENLRFNNCYYEDLDIFYRFLALASKIIYLPYYLYGYRQHQASFIHRFSVKRFDALDVTDRLLQWVSENSPRHIPAVADRRFSAHLNILVLICNCRTQINTMIQKGEISSELVSRIEARCWNVIKTQRFNSLRNPDVRLKNRLGALVAIIGGKPLIRFIARFYS